MDRLLSKRARRTRDCSISYLLKVALETPGVISLAAGLVDQETLPAGKVAELLAFLQKDEHYRLPSLQYGSTEGLLCLRRAIIDYLRESDGAAYPDDKFGADNMVITNGSQQFLHLIADCLLDPGDIVLVSDPTYFVFMDVLNSAGARTLGIEFDDHGMVPESLERTVEALKASGDIDRLKMIYVITYYQNPTGISLAPERRKRIFDLVRRLDAEGRFVCLLEDTAYRELYFDQEQGDASPSIKAMDTENKYVAMTGSFSKAFAPGLRLGYAIMPSWLTPHILRQKGNEDFGSSNLTQHLAWAALKTGKLKPHSADLRAMYRRKCEIMIRAIEEHFPEGVRWVVPSGGLYVWATLPEGIETGGDSLLFKAALDHKVLYVPGEYCYAARPEGPPNRRSMRLTYAYISEKEIVEGVRRLGAAMAEVMNLARV